MELIPGSWICLLVLAVPHLATATAATAANTCSAADLGPLPHDYSQVFASHHGSAIHLAELPGFTRSVYTRDHALITPESRVWAGQPGWTNSLTCHLISPATGRASFSMFLANMSAGAAAPGAPAEDVERFVLVLEGSAKVAHEDGSEVALGSNHYAYFPPGSASRLSSASGAGLLLWERKYTAKGKPTFQHGFVDDAPLLPVPGEVFGLRKLLPQAGQSAG